MRTRILRALVMLATVACSLAMVTPARAAVSKQALPPDPQALPPTGNCVIDNIFYGAVPPGGSHAPVLVFVHGLSGLALDWWTDQTYAGRNEMYSRAYGAGYRTAFVNLNVDDNTPPDCSVERRPANDNYVNGAVLAQQLDAITQYYGVSQVDIIAHSKGGIDAQTAIVWSGARSKVHSLFTMGTPHQGSILVDQLWSPEGAWLAGLLGQLDDATYAMQTPVMQEFRAATDPLTVDDGVNYYSGAGNFWDVQGVPILRITGNWLQNQADGGDNDAVVTVASTYLPGATPLFLEPWTHIELYMGQNSFSRILPYLPVEVNAPTSVTITGPSFGVVGSDYVFTALTGPDFASTPLTYTWQATDLATLEVSGGIRDTRNLRWQRPGWKAVRITVANGAGTVSATQYLYVFPTNAQIRTTYLPLALGGAGTNAGSQPVVRETSPAPSAGSVPASGTLNQIARGGLIDGPLTATFPVEPQAKDVVFTVLVSDPSLTASLQAPDGTTSPLQAVSTEGAVLFEGATAWQMDVANPQPGDWQLLLDGQRGGAYYALATLDSSLQVSLDGFPTAAVPADQPLHLQSAVHDSQATSTAQDRSQVSQVTLTTVDAGRVREAMSATGATLDYRLDGLNGVRGATVRITGQTGDGYSFERTYSRSLMIATQSGSTGLDNSRSN